MTFCCEQFLKETLEMSEEQQEQDFTREGDAGRKMEGWVAGGVRRSCLLFPALSCDVEGGVEGATTAWLCAVNGQLSKVR